jgi:predicted enzyme related to lactoylglutathione lyase
MEQDWARPVVHWEFQARDPERMRVFYRQMFNWQIAEGPIMQIGPAIGAPELVTGHILPGERSRVVLYIQVLDLRASMEQAKALGGALTRDPIDIPGGPTIAGIADPEENAIVLVQQ